VKPTEKETDAASGAGFAFTATHATIIVALLGVTGAGVGAIFTARENLKLEQTKHEAAADLARQEFETKLIFRAIEGSDSAEERIRNLKFFLEAGFLTDPKHTIEKLDPSKFPSKVSPSFDCMRDTDPAARMICATPGLSTQDRVMAKLYYQLKGSLSGSSEQLQQLVDAQREWLRQRDACAIATEAVSCMVDKYDLRIRQLQVQIAAQVAITRADEGHEKPPSSRDH
jgi:uncharacterized protein